MCVSGYKKQWHLTTKNQIYSDSVLPKAGFSLVWFGFMAYQQLLVI